MPVSYTHLDVYKRQLFKVKTTYMVPLVLSRVTELFFKWIGSQPIIQPSNGGGDRCFEVEVHVP